MVRKILFVCTGNAARSPMARVLFEDMVSKDLSLQSADIEVDCAGISAELSPGTPATQESIQIMRGYGLDLSSHESKSLDDRLVKWSDLILVMQANHKEVVASRFRDAGKKTHLLAEYVGEIGEVPLKTDAGIQTYKDCASLLSSLLSKLANRLQSSQD